MITSDSLTSEKLTADRLKYYHPTTAASASAASAPSASASAAPTSTASPAAGRRYQGGKGGRRDPPAPSAPKKPIKSTRDFDKKHPFNFYNVYVKTKSTFDAINFCDDECFETIRIIETIGLNVEYAWDDVCLECLHVVKKSWYKAYDKLASNFDRQDDTRDNDFFEHKIYDIDSAIDCHAMIVHKQHAGQCTAASAASAASAAPAAASAGASAYDGKTGPNKPAELLGSDAAESDADASDASDASGSGSDASESQDSASEQQPPAQLKKQPHKSLCMISERDAAKIRMSSPTQRAAVEAALAEAKRYADEDRALTEAALASISAAAPDSQPDAAPESQAAAPESQAAAPESQAADPSGSRSEVPKKLNYTLNMDVYCQSDAYRTALGDFVKADYQHRVAQKKVQDALELSKKIQADLNRLNLRRIGLDAELAEKAKVLDKALNAKRRIYDDFILEKAAKRRKM
jgi:hypothetical protein